MDAFFHKWLIFKLSSTGREISHINNMAAKLATTTFLSKTISKQIASAKKIRPFATIFAEASDMLTQIQQNKSYQKVALSKAI